MPAALGLLYVVLVHLAVLHHEPWLECAALVLLCAIAQYRSLRSGRGSAWLLLIALAAGCCGLTLAGGALYALYLPPVLLPSLVLVVFAGSLRRGQVPIVARIAETTRGRLTPERLHYCRQITWLWVALLVLQIVVAMTLAITGPIWLWSAVTNFGNYLLMGLVFVVEYIYRRLRFRGEPEQGFLDYLRTLARTRYMPA